MSILTGLVIVVAMATLAQRSDSLIDLVSRDDAPKIAPQNDEAVMFAGESQVIDVLRNDENSTPEDGENIRIVVSPSCGAAEATSDGVLYISNELCVGPQLFAYCIEQGDECPSASVTVNVAAAAPGALRLARQNETDRIVGSSGAGDDTRLSGGQTQQPSTSASRVAAAPKIVDDASAPRVGAAPQRGATAQQGDAISTRIGAEQGAVVAAVRPSAPQETSIGRLANAPQVRDDGGVAPSLPSLNKETLGDETEPRVSLTPTARPRFERDGSDASARRNDDTGTGQVRVAALPASTEPETSAQSPDVTAIETQPSTPEPNITEVARLEDPGAGSTADRIRDDAVEAIRQGRATTPSAGSNAIQPASCGPIDMTSLAYAGAQSIVRVNSACRADMTFEIEHGGMRFGGRLDEAGAGEIRIPVLDDTGAARILFADGSVADGVLDFNWREVELTLRVAVGWTAPVDLNLHAFEYAAQFGADGHVWQESPSGFRRVRRSGGGYLANYPAVAEGGQSIEIYTFWANSRARRGVARIALDHASRGDVADGAFCEGGALASPEYTVVRSERGKISSTARGRFEPAACGQTLDQAARYASGALRDLRID